MAAQIAVLKRLSRFFLEVSPFIAALLIAGYVAADMSRSRSDLEAIVPAQAPELASGEELTALIKEAHAAAFVAAPAPAPVQAAAAETTSQPPAIKATSVRKPSVATREHPARQKPQAVARQDVPAPAFASAVAAQPPPPAPQQLAPEAPKEEPGWYGRTVSTVSGWGGKAARTTGLDSAAEVVVAAPGAVARASKRALDAVANAADALLPSR